MINRVLSLSVVAMLALMGTCMSTVYVDPGNVGVVVHKNGGGVDPVVLEPGFHGRNPLLTVIEEYPVKMQTIVLAGEAEGINVNDKQGQPVSLDISLSFELNPMQTAALYKTFRASIEQVAHSYIKNTIRQALQETVGTEDVSDVLGPKKGEVVQLATVKIGKALQEYGVIVKQFTITEVRPPQSLIAAINAKNQQLQLAQTEKNRLATASYKAQGDSIAASGGAKAIMAEARAKADAAELLNRAGSSPQYLRLLELENQKAAIAKWDGSLPSWIGGGSPIPFIDVNKKP